MGQAVSLYDTNILVDALRAVPQAVSLLNTDGPHRISRISWIEIMAGARDRQEEATLESFLDRFAVVELSADVGREAARLRRTLKIKLPDAMIYASALAVSDVLLTRNTKDFPGTLDYVRVPYRLK